MSCFVQKVLVIKSRSLRKAEHMYTVFLALNFWEGRPRLFYRRLLARFISTVGQSLVEFRLLPSVCEAWQWSRIQNLWSVGKNDGTILSRLWTKIRDFLIRCRRPLSFPMHLADYVYRVWFRRYRPLSAVKVAKSSTKVILGPRLLEIMHIKLFLWRPTNPRSTWLLASDRSSLVGLCSVHARLQVSVCSGYYLYHPG